MKAQDQPTSDANVDNLNMQIHSSDQEQGLNKNTKGTTEDLKPDKMLEIKEEDVIGIKPGVSGVPNQSESTLQEPITRTLLRDLFNIFERSKMVFARTDEETR